MPRWPGAIRNTHMRIQNPESLSRDGRHHALSAMAFMHRTHNTARYGQVCCDLYAHNPTIRDDLRHVRRRVPKQTRPRSLQVQLLVSSYLGKSEENRTPISAAKGPYPGR